MQKALDAGFLHFEKFATLLANLEWTFPGTAAAEDLTLWHGMTRVTFQKPVHANGMGGDDTLHGGISSDTPNGGDGDGFIVSESGRDVARGGKGSDVIMANAVEAPDLIDEVGGNKRFHGDTGNDALNGGETETTRSTAATAAT
ncbi:hypothetical protein LAZ40_09775 [Cereibacter sphaeroides]|uniref:hypothetical protein n=1 Tax=Cereibacter sphaeroides TaxID=1063 RepID=UPI001F1A85E6|nr:hypothetical protein [Cereibacter sphaeroides]MCE6959339.1 hypothetical protein [Cereibacter sphaeroides]MCE6972931.1 hypothetical protein [Cereibacter sphaeroides]